MIKNITFSEFTDSFSGSYENNFSYYGKKALFEYLEDLEEQLDSPIELDAVSLCCEYSEYENAIEAYKEHNTEPEEVTEDEARDWLEYRTTVISTDKGGVVIAQF